MNLPREFNFSWPFPKKPSRFYNLKSRAIITLVYVLSKSMFMGGINKLKINNKKTFIDLLSDTSKPLLTVSNHRCNVDDPLMWSILTFNEFFKNISRFRYTLAAHNICFTTQLHSSLFSLGRCVPCVRGAGVFQAGVDLCVDVLSNKGWVHVFPEGRVTKNPIRIKWGISRLIYESKIPPILLPIWVEGMANITSEKAPYYPKIGKEVEITIGEPIDTNYLLNEFQSTSELELRKKIADFVQSKLYSLGNARFSP